MAAPDTPANPAWPVALRAAEVPPRAVQSGYPPDLAAKLGGREKRVLGDRFGLRSFGVNLTRLPPGARSSLRHAHAVQDEFVYILEGEAVLLTDAGETPLSPGMCAGFRGGSGDAHCLENRGARDVLYLEIGDRQPGDSASYPDDDLAVAMGPDGRWRYSRKDGTPLKRAARPGGDRRPPCPSSPMTRPRRSPGAPATASGGWPAPSRASAARSGWR